MSELPLQPGYDMTLCADAVAARASVMSTRSMADGDYEDVAEQE